MISYWQFFVSISVLITTTSCNEDLAEYDTIVVGLGAAGTVAASTLARAGKRVLALEAQDHVGGRVYTVPFGDGVVEVGAEWIFGQRPSLVYDTAVENNITVLLQGEKTALYLSNGIRANNSVTEIVNKGISFEDDDDIDKPEPLGQLITRKLTNYLKENKPDVYDDKDLVTQILALISLVLDGSEASNDWSEVNAAGAYETLDGPQHTSWHRNGFKTFFELLLNKYKGGEGLPSLTIKLNTEVTKIEWPQESDGKVSVTTKDGTVYNADNVIVTVSLGVLKERYQSLFTTALPEEKITAIEMLQMGTIGKIILSFPNAWWPNKNVGEGFYGFLWRGEDLKEIVSEDVWLTKIFGAHAPLGSSNTITLWTSGDIAKQVEVMPEDVVRTKAIILLKQFLGANVTIPEPTGFLRSKWFSNQFTRGTYTYDSMIAVGYPTARLDLAATLKDASGKPRVLFAGEATNPKSYGTVHGAADTGRREAMRLLGTLRHDSF